jgi:hypothetical protein
MKIWDLIGGNGVINIDLGYPHSDGSRLAFSPDCKIVAVSLLGFYAW